MDTLFNFSGNTITSYINYDLKTISKLKPTINYILKLLEVNSLTIDNLDDKIDLSKIVERKGKNYNWSVINYKNISLLIRSYGHHLIVFCKITTKHEYDSGSWNESTLGAFTFYSNIDKIEKCDNDDFYEKFINNSFVDLEVVIKDLLIGIIENDGVHFVWNNYSLPRPDYIDIKVAFYRDQIMSLDLFVFCMEEVSNIYLELFAENDMFLKLQEFKDKIGTPFNSKLKINNVFCDLKDEYYHGVGIEFIGESGKKEFQDVYSLSRWYYKEIFLGSN